MLFGNNTGKRKSPFGGVFDPPDWEASAPGGGFGGGLGQHAYAQQNAAPEPPKRNGTKRAFGIASEFLAGMTGAPSLYMPMVQKEREAELAEAQYQRQRADSYADWQKKQEWEIKNKPAANNDTVNDWNFYNSLPEDQREAYLNYLDLTKPIVTTDASGRPHVTRRVQQKPQPVQIDPSDWDSAAPLTTGGPAPAGQPPFAGNANAAGDRLDYITMMSESGGNPNAVSPKGARGLMQVMPATARDPGFGIRPSNGTPEDDVRVGKEYRRAMQQRYSNNLPRMWGAYNAGPGRVDDLIARYGERWLDYAPAETRAYVARNMRAARGN